MLFCKNGAGDWTTAHDRRKACQVAAPMPSVIVRQGSTHTAAVALRHYVDEVRMAIGQLSGDQIDEIAVGANEIIDDQADGPPAKRRSGIDELRERSPRLSQQMIARGAG